MDKAIHWFAHNPVAANLLMFVMLAGGIIALFNINQEEFPNPDPNMVTVNVAYRGATPEEVEHSVCIPIEEAIEGVEGVDRMQSISSEGNCTVTLELLDGADVIAVLNEVKSLVDAINGFPLDIERPVVAKPALYKTVITIAVHGDISERMLKEISRDLRDDIAALESVSQVHTSYVRPYEIAIEVAEDTLRRYRLTLAGLRQTVAAASLDMPGGSIKTDSGEVLIRTKGQAYNESDFSTIPVVSRADGTRITLGEIAQIHDGFEESDLIARFNGEPAALVEVQQVGTEDLMQIAADVNVLIEEQRLRLPPGVSLTTWKDTSRNLEARLSILLNTAGSGLLLVMMILAAFLRFRLALWVAAGIPIALLGTVALFPYADITISTMTVMAFILVVGILVDDAIVVGERIYAHEQMGKDPVQAAIDGTREVSVPVIFGVLTTIAAFLPLALMTGQMSAFFSVIGVIVIIALLLSILESQLILPAHLAYRNHKEATQGIARSWNRMQGALSDWLTRVADKYYLPLAQRCVEARYLSAAIGTGVLILAIGLVASGRLVVQFFPSVEGDQISAQLEMPEGVVAEDTIQAAEELERAAAQLAVELQAEFDGKNIITNQFTSIGVMTQQAGPGRPQGPARSHFAQVMLAVVPLEERNQMSAKLIADRWRELTAPIPDAVKLLFSADYFSMGSAIDYRLQGKSIDDLSAAAADLRAELARYNGVTDITDSFRSGKQEIQLHLLPEASSLGLTLSDLATQVRHAFYGAEIQRVQRNQDEVRVMIRFPESERRAIGNLEDMYIRTPSGVEVPFYSVAEFEIQKGFSKIEHSDGLRTVDVTADVNRLVVSPEEINTGIFADFIPKLKVKYPGVNAEIGGEMERAASSMGGLGQGLMLALLIIFTLLAIPLKSYTQPLVIMSVIPFGIVGAVIGHWLLSVSLVFFSLLGIVALSGVVVNGSLVLVDYINRQRSEGVPLNDAILNACATRFRPILLTSVTTFVGLLPLMTTQTPITLPFLPMAVSLGFGVLFATFITLFLVPALYMIQEDMQAFLSRRVRASVQSESGSHG